MDISEIHFNCNSFCFQKRLFPHRVDVVMWWMLRNLSSKATALPQKMEVAEEVQMFRRFYNSIWFCLHKAKSLTVNVRCFIL